MRTLAAAIAGLTLALSGAVLPIVPGAVAADSPAVAGRWSNPFAEPTVAGRRTDEVCIDESQEGDAHDGKHVTCKPAAGSLAVLGGRDVVYWNALEDTEEVEASIVAEFGAVSINDQVRRLRLADDPGQLASSTWTTSTPDDSGANPSGYENDPLFPPPLSSSETYNDGALFCSSLTFLPDGRVLAAGGTAYYHDPAIASKFGVSELEGMRNSRIYDPATNSWSQAGDMAYGRWYPSLVPLADGDVFVASGVKRLVKTGYPDQAIDGGDPVDAAMDSGRNVVDTETYDTATGTWSENPDTADRSLPLFPRLHLLPNGSVYFNSAGQVFNPDGYAYDELLWNRTGLYDPATKAWSDGAIPGLGTAAPGFRGSTFSVMLPLRPEADGSYSKASFLTAGGIVGVSPGTYLAVADSRIDTVDTSSSSPVQSTTATGPLARPRWYGTGVLSPTGEVFAFSGASADEVVGPGTAIPVTVPEVFTPAENAEGGGTWAPLAGARERRTYHNTAALLPDGRILVGGHAPIPTLYGNNTTLVEGTTSPQETRNPSFEIFEPPYLFRGDRPRIVESPAAAAPTGGTFDVVLAGSGAAADVDSVVLMRRTAITHLVDGGQRAVELPVVARNGNVVTVRMPSQPAVLPAGPYLLFVNGRGDGGAGPVPSVAADITVLLPGAGAGGASAGNGHGRPVTVASAAPARPRVDVVAALGVPVDAEVAFHEIAEVAGRPDGHAGVHEHVHNFVPARAPGQSNSDDGVPLLPAVAAVAALALVAGATVRRASRGIRGLYPPSR